MACNSATMAWRASVRARALPISRLSQRPSALLQKRAQRYPGASRYASDSAAPAEAAKETVKDATKEAAKEIPRKAGRGSKKALYGASLALTLLVGYIYGTDTRASIHRYGVVPLIRFLWPDAEDAHHIGVENLKMLYKYGLHPRERGDPDSDGALATEVFGYTLSNPIGISAGLDKHADVPDALLDIGPAIVEVGGTTPLPQEGNPKPRVFRLPSQHAMINRYGLNSKGADHMAKVLKQRVSDFAYAAGFGLHEQSEQRVLDGEANVPPGSLVPGKLLAVQVAKNKLTPDGDIEAIKRDYVYCVDRVAPYADILVVNVSSPNTPGLRDLQAAAPLTAILTAVVASAKNVQRKTKPYVMVKVSPDEDSNEQISGICEAVWNSGVDGVIVGNTTNRRPDPLPQGFVLPAEEQKTLKETGGYSGPQLFDRSVALVARYRAMLDQGPPSATDSDKSIVSQLPRKVIFASGGITTGKEARAALDAGASVAMMYTGVVYGGVGTVTRVKQELREELKK
ncbi:Aldolase-type TIM barrel [Penicillium griseofulvum]|uniref:Dihydroorotate dehydrogenase (quinone), mitochondrial n=1 Tax=Penicillium patulum TaxID=5078 RepID=A0A135LYW3_PENPA|nr:Aldolase-type TIM barrel [Penicillium griseofulvum]KXG54164.1 Aldolase-type TIM barrel [Penicillium griseofulvum]